MKFNKILSTSLSRRRALVQWLMNEVKIQTHILLTLGNLIKYLLRDHLPLMLEACLFPSVFLPRFPKILNHFVVFGK